MEVIVLGGGIVGVATAYALNRAGAGVTLVERESDVALATSRGNAGVIAPAYVTPWAAPGMPGKIAKYLFQRTSPVIFRPTADLRQWRWLARWLKECELARFRVNKQRMQRIAYYSRACLTETRTRHGIEYGRSEGYLQLFRSAYDEEMARPAMRILNEAGLAHRLLDRAGCIAVEPALASAPVQPHAGLHLPGDEAGDCAAFAARLRDIAAAAGVSFRFGVSARGLIGSRGGVQGVLLADGMRLSADAVVVAAGIHSRALLQPFGIDLPLYPVKGYSATLPVSDDARAPRAALMDEAFKTAITRMGDTVRVAGTAEFGDGRLRVRPAAAQTLRKVLHDWFPQAGDLSRATLWVGSRPMTPDGPPLLGATHVPGLYLNTGHGSTGWAMSMGSGQVLADLLTGREPAIDLEGLTLARYA